MGDSRTTTVEIRTDLLEALRELHPGRSDREIVEAAVREYLQRCEARPGPRLSRPRGLMPNRSPALPTSPGPSVP